MLCLIELLQLNTYTLKWLENWLLNWRMLEVQEDDWNQDKKESLRAPQHHTQYTLPLQPRLIQNGRSG